MKALTKDDLRQFTGDLVRYRHYLNPNVIYTPGVRHIAEHGEAFWLVDAIASWIGSEPFREASTQDYRINQMHFWTLTVAEDNSATLYAKADSPEDAFIVQTIPYTDFPLGEIRIWAGFDGEQWTLYLPSEH